MSGNPDYWAGFVVGAAGVLIILRVLDWLKARKDRRCAAPPSAPAGTTKKDQSNQRLSGAQHHSEQDPRASAETQRSSHTDGSDELKESGGAAMAEGSAK